MTVDEKLENAIRKKEIGIKLISEKEFKRALKIFQNINSFFDLGKFTEDDLKRIKPVLYKKNKRIKTIFTCLVNKDQKAAIQIKLNIKYMAIKFLCILEFH
jgi:hypothetical protein